jgi:hypothetical protein
MAGGISGNVAGGCPPDVAVSGVAAKVNADATAQANQEAADKIEEIEAESATKAAQENADAALKKK